VFVNSKKIIKIMNEIAPEKLAENWDNVGFLVGNEDSEVDRVMVALEVTETVVNEAIQNNIDLIICHHPLIFKPMKTVTDSDPIGRIVKSLIKHDIGLYAAHTNLDIADGGTNDYVAELLGLNKVTGLEKTSSNKFYKLAVYVPADNLDDVTKAAGNAGAGHIGEYSDCAFACEGEGQFRPLAGSDPYIGTHGELERVKEHKLEVLVGGENLNKVIQAVLKAHPYEVPAYDVWQLDNEIESFYLGRYGLVEGKVNLVDYAGFVQEKLAVKSLKYVGDPERTIRKVAICTGAGADVMKSAVRNGCDLLITGDVKYHEAQTAIQLKLSLIDAGHFETEQIFVKRLSEKLKKAFAYKEYDVVVIESKEEENPFKTL